MVDVIKTMYEHRLVLELIVALLVGKMVGGWLEASKAIKFAREGFILFKEGVAGLGTRIMESISSFNLWAVAIMGVVWAFHALDQASKQEKASWEKGTLEFAAQVDKMKLSAVEAAISNQGRDYERAKAERERLQKEGTTKKVSTGLEGGTVEVEDYEKMMALRTATFAENAEQEKLNILLQKYNQLVLDAKPKVVAEDMTSKVHKNNAEAIKAEIQYLKDLDKEQQEETATLISGWKAQYDAGKISYTKFFEEKAKAEKASYETSAAYMAAEKANIPEVYKELMDAVGSEKKTTGTEKDAERSKLREQEARDLAKADADAAKRARGFTVESNKDDTESLKIQRELTKAARERTLAQLEMDLVSGKHDPVVTMTKQLALLEQMKDAETLKLAEYDKETPLWYAQEKAVDELAKKIVNLQSKLEDYTGSLWEGMSAGMKEYVSKSTSAYTSGKTLITTLSDQMGSELQNFFDSTSAGFMKWKDLIKNVLSEVYKELVKTFITNKIISALSSALSSLGNLGKPSAGAQSTDLVGNMKGDWIAQQYIGKASGGSVSSGQTYVVGENGPELLKMGSDSGNITPNNKLGSGNAPNVTINIENNGQAVSAETKGVSFDAEGMIVGVVLKNMNNYGPLYHAVQGASARG
jgi:hypothetical protein